MERFNELARFMGHVSNLKKTERTGWVRRGIQNPESVADHSFRTALMAMVLSNKSDVNQNTVIKMALIHDLAESLVGDLTPFDTITPKEKSHLEEEAFKKLCSDIDNGDELLGLFREYEEGITPEARFTKRLDKLEMMFQAHEYNQDQPNVDLRSFWTHIQTFDFGDLQETYNALEADHNKPHS
ncbi:MAG: HD domain-containing protein [Microgenomates group bacterium]|jgi:putative hydrolase of HD superfamily